VLELALRLRYAAMDCAMAALLLDAAQLNTGRYADLSGSNHGGEMSCVSLFN
jgi:hypothetical protein